MCREEDEEHAKRKKHDRRPFLNKTDVWDETFRGNDVYCTELSCIRPAAGQHTQLTIKIKRGEYCHEFTNLSGPCYAGVGKHCENLNEQKMSDIRTLNALAWQPSNLHIVDPNTDKCYIDIHFVEPVRRPCSCKQHQSDSNKDSSG